MKHSTLSGCLSRALSGLEVTNQSMLGILFCFGSMSFSFPSILVSYSENNNFHYKWKQYLWNLHKVQWWFAGICTECCLAHKLFFVKTEGDGDTKHFNVVEQHLLLLLFLSEDERSIQWLIAQRESFYIREWTRIWDKLWILSFRMTWDTFPTGPNWKKCFHYSFYDIYLYMEMKNHLMKNFTDI